MPAQALMPRDPVPAMNVALTTGGRFVLGANPGEHFDLMVFAATPASPMLARVWPILYRLIHKLAHSFKG